MQKIDKKKKSIKIIIYYEFILHTNKFHINIKPQREI